MAIESRGKYFYDEIITALSGLSSTYDITAVFNIDNPFISSKPVISVYVGDDLTEESIVNEGKHRVSIRNVDFQIYVAYKIQDSSDELALKKQRWIISEKIREHLAPYISMGKKWATQEYTSGAYTCKILIREMTLDDFYFAEVLSEDNNSNYEIMQVRGNIKYREN